MIDPSSLMPVNVSSTVSKVASVLGAYKYRGVDEPHMHMLIIRAFDINKVEYEHEAWLSGSERIDFLCGKVGVEVKVQGQPATVLSQLGRYAESGKLDVLMLASTQKRLLAVVPAEIHGVPTVPVLLKRSGL